MDYTRNSNEVAIEVEEEIVEECSSSTVSNSVDPNNRTGRNGDEPKRTSFIWNTKRGWKAASIVLANQGLTRLAFIGVSVNLVLFFTRVLDQNNVDAANDVNKWNGVVYLCSLIGAFLSDSYLGRYLTCALSQVIFVLGLVLLSTSTSIFLIKPDGCGDGKVDCEPTTRIGVITFNLSIYLIALGYGGHQPNIATFGADQFDETDEKQKDLRTTFFSYLYFALNSGSLFSNTIVAYYENSGEWTLGFLVCLGSAVVALTSFLIASPAYNYVKPCGNPFPRIAQVFVAAMRKWRVKPANASNLYELHGHGSTIKASKKNRHVHGLKWLDKAATRTENDLNQPKQSAWRLCTVTQVEETKCILKLLPIWLCTIIYSVILAQISSLFVEQGNVMNAKIGKFNMPAASMSTFGVCSVLICTCIYRKIIVPLVGKLSGNPKGLTELQRMGIGLVIGMLSMIAAGVTEIKRLNHVIKGQKISSLSIFWQTPQYVLVGASEVFMCVGQLEFFNEQAPHGMKSIGSSFCMASLSLGRYVSTLLIIMVMKITARGTSPGWIPKDMNVGHVERFYFLIAGLTAFDCVIYYFCAKWYNSINNIDEEQNPEMQDHDEVDDNTVNERV